MSLSLLLTTLLLAPPPPPPPTTQPATRPAMFYAGAYNNEPHQIGLATSRDGVTWARATADPFLPSGPPGAWNASESGHPFAFTDDDAQLHLFYQGNNDRGRTWYLSRAKIAWHADRPTLAPD